MTETVPVLNQPNTKQTPLRILPTLPFKWEQGEHLAVVGETGSGKSTLAAALLALRWQFVAIVRTKPDRVRYQARRVATAADFERRREASILLDLSGKHREEQRKETEALTHTVWTQGGWTVYFDELFYLEYIGLTEEVEHLLTQGRSKDLTIVVGMQRPARVSRFALSQSTHVLSFGQEGRDAKILGEATSKRMELAVNSLRKHEFAWYFRPDREIWTGRLQDLVKGS